MLVAHHEQYSLATDRQLIVAPDIAIAICQTPSYEVQQMKEKTPE
jgi:hypothetical protein